MDRVDGYMSNERGNSTHFLPDFPVRQDSRSGDLKGEPSFLISSKTSNPLFCPLETPPSEYRPNPDNLYRSLKNAPGKDRCVCCLTIDPSTLYRHSPRKLQDRTPMPPLRVCCARGQWPSYIIVQSRPLIKHSAQKGSARRRQPKADQIITASLQRRRVIKR